MMVMFAFATTACSKKTNDYVIMLKNHERALHINAAGKVTATDISLAQFFTMESVTDALSDTFRIALYVKEVGRYLCFRKGKLVGMKHLVPDCHFIEKMDHGYFLYANAYKPEWRVGFTRGLKPVGPRHLQRPQTMRRACFLFVKINAEHFDRDMFTTTTTTTTTTTMSPLKKLIESRDQHSIRDYGLEEYERRLNSSRGRNYRTHSRTEPERRRGSTGGGGGGGGVGHRHRSPETRHRNVSNTPQPKNLRRPQPTQKAGEERRKKTQRENVRRVHTNGQRKRKQVDSHYDHSDLPPNSQSSRAGGGTSSSSSASSTASVTATSLAATVSLAPSALNLVAMLAASRRKRVKRKKLEEEQEQEESETQASGGNAEKQRSANSDLQLVAHDDGHESEQLYDLPAKKARKSQTTHDHSYHQKSSYADQMPVATTPEHFVQQPQNHKYSNSNAKKFHSHKRSNNSHHSRNSHRQQQLQEEGEERDEEEEEEAENPSHSLSSSGNNNKNNYLNENLSKLTKLKTNTNINLNLNTNINNNTNNLNANAILPALPKNFNNTDKQNSHNNQAKQYLNLMTDFKQLKTPTPALNVSQQPQHQQHHRRQHHNNNGVKHSLRRHRHKRDLGFSLPQLSATSQMTRPQPRSNADELRGLVNKENELPTFHRRSSDVESLDNSKRVEYEEEHDNYDADADENGGDTINKSNRLLDNNNNNHKLLSEDNNFLQQQQQQQQQQQRQQPSGLPFNRLKYPNNVNRISSDDDDDDDDDVDVSSMKLQKQNIPNEHNIASHYLESDANYNPMKIRYNKANYLNAAATTTTKNNNNNINITNNVNKPNASFSGVFSQLNVINNSNYMRHQSRSRSSSSSSVSAVKKTNVNNNITRHNVIIISNVLNNDDIDVSGSGTAATATATAFQTRFVLGQKNMYRQLQQQKTQQQQQVIDNKFITNTNLKNNNINVHYIYNHNEKKTKQNDVNDDDDDDVYENFIKTENKYEKIIVQYRSVVQII